MGWKRLVEWVVLTVRGFNLSEGGAALYDGFDIEWSFTGSAPLPNVRDDRGPNTSLIFRPTLDHKLLTFKISRMCFNLSCCR